MARAQGLPHTEAHSQGNSWGGSSPYHHGSPDAGCLCVCARLYTRAGMCTAQVVSNRQCFQEHVPTALVTAERGSYKYCISRTEIGIHTCCSVSTRQGKRAVLSAVPEVCLLVRQV